MDNIIVEEKAVQVTNISPQANQKTVSDFFSFCGKIAKLFLKKDESTDTFSAVVQFETESAAKTALLLTNALIIDRPIVVSQFKNPAPSTTTTTATNTHAEQPKVDLGTPVPESNITQRDFQVPDEQRSKTSVIASLLSAGFILGKDAFEKAKDVDEKHKITPAVKEFAETVKAKAHEIDEQLKISQTVTNVATVITEKAKQINEEYKIGEKAQQGVNLVETKAAEAFNKAKENPTIAKGVETVSSTAQNLFSVVSAKLTEYKDETQKAIEQKEKERHPQGTAQQQPETVNQSTPSEVPLYPSLNTSEVATNTTTTSNPPPEQK